MPSVEALYSGVAAPIFARVIGERKVRTGIRRTLWAQARRLETLAKERLDSFSE